MIKLIEKDKKWDSVIEKINRENGKSIDPEQLAKKLSNESINKNIQKKLIFK